MAKYSDLLTLPVLSCLYEPQHEIMYRSEDSDSPNHGGVGGARAPNAPAQSSQSVGCTLCAGISKDWMLL